mgnify:CR=1 FL=1
MERIENWNEIKESGNSTMLKPDGYIVKITDVKDVQDKKYLEIHFDIAQGEFKAYFEQLMAQHGFWAGKYCASYGEKAQNLFKRFISCIERSNTGYTFNFDETTLKGKFVGMTLTQEEYIKQDGSKGKRTKVAKIYDVADIENGNYKIPDVITIPDQVQNVPVVADDSDLPF